MFKLNILDRENSLASYGRHMNFNTARLGSFFFDSHPKTLRKHQKGPKKGEKNPPVRDVISKKTLSRRLRLTTKKSEVVSQIFSEMGADFF